VLRCPCGTALEGASEDEIVDVSLTHMREEHPDMACRWISASAARKVVPGGVPPVTDGSAGSDRIVSR
jgi:hypothetical protein